MPTVLESLNIALHQAFSERENVYLLGEDVLDPYGGAFKVTRGLSATYPDRVLTTPISEAGIVGLGAGMALRSLRPVIEVMFGDFITLAADQIVNHIAKFRYMYNDQVRLPLVIRTPMGGRRGYGPTHSQTLEKMFLGVPGLQVVAPASLSDQSGSGSPGDLLYHSILDNDDPLIFIENKLQYLLPVQSQAELDDFTLTVVPAIPGGDFPSYRLDIKGAPAATMTIAAYGYMAELARQAALRLAFEHEIFAELVIPTQLAPFDVRAIQDSASHTGALLVAEEGNLSLGWGAEIVARVAEALGAQPARYRRIAAMDVPVPASGPLESQVLPGVDQIVQSALRLHQEIIQQIT
jgi:pyruvate/2-oxoglutarate/acetoin dehydrogenase E1 component